MGYNQLSIVFAVCGNDIPGRVPGARRTEALLVRRHVLIPEFSFLNVRQAELPVFCRLIDTCQKALALLLLREMEEELDDARTADVEMFLQIRDLTIPVLPDRLVVTRRIREPLAAENLVMHTDDQHFLVIGTVKDVDPPPFR